MNLVLDLVGYVDADDLASRFAVEPAAGEGAFLLPMVRRLVASCARHGRPIEDAASALRAYELSDESAAVARTAIAAELVRLGVQDGLATALACGWITVGDYLLNWTHDPAADFVIGNPPYIRLEDVPEPTMALYRRMYRTMIGRADIYVAFFEAALRSLTPNGTCGFVCADRWMLNHYGTELRRFVSQGFGVEAVIEMHRADAFDSQVSAYPAVSIIRKAAQGSALVASAGADAGGDGPANLASALQQATSATSAWTMPRGFRATRVDGWFDPGEPWPCVSPDRLTLLKRLESQFHPLEDPTNSTRVGIGVATGADKVFVTREAEAVEPSRLLPLALASDTRDGTLRWSGHHLVNPWECDGRLVDLAAYPRLREYLGAHRQTLRRRHIAVRRPEAWYRTIDAVHHNLTGRAKLYFPDIKGVIHPVLDNGATYPHHNLYYVQSDGWDIEILGGLLLSSVAQFFVECYAVRMRGGWLRFQAQYLRRIRIPNPSDIPTTLGEQLRSAFRARDVALANKAAFELYGIRDIPREDDHGS